MSGRRGRDRGSDEGEEGPRIASPRLARDAERTKAAILTAAVAEFAEKGFSGARVDSIVARAGVNQRMLYYYFYSKSAIYVAVLEHVHAALLAAMADATTEDQNPVEEMATLIRSTWDHYLRHPSHVSILNSITLSTPKPRTDTVLRRPSPIIARLTTSLRLGAAQGAFRAGVDPILVDISVAALCTFYLAHGRALSSAYGRDLGSPAALDAWRDHVVTSVLAMVQSTPPRIAGTQQP